MKIKKDFLLRTVAGQTVVVPTGDNVANFNAAITLNETAAFLWEVLQNDTNEETLLVKYKGKSIADVLDMTVEEGMNFFSSIPKIYRKIKTLYEVGLGYIKLGQSATTLSGGEAQRVKLATELSKRSTGKTIYILDEPTTGLHTADVHRLLEVLLRLVEAGNTVLTIEHNLDVIKTADYIIDLGPEGGDGGGRIVATGTPEEVAKVSKSFTGKYLKGIL
jgi:excinuclease ABC subunit A